MYEAVIFTVTYQHYMNVKNTIKICVCDSLSGKQFLWSKTAKIHGFFWVNHSVGTADVGLKKLKTRKNC